MYLCVCECVVCLECVVLFRHCCYFSMPFYHLLVSLLGVKMTSAGGGKPRRQSWSPFHGKHGESTTKPPHINQVTINYYTEKNPTTTLDQRNYFSYLNEPISFDLNVLLKTVTKKVEFSLKFSLFNAVCLFYYYVYVNIPNVNLSLSLAAPNRRWRRLNSGRSLSIS